MMYAGAQLAEQREEPDLAAPTSPGGVRQSRGTRLADLLMAAAVLAAEMGLEELLERGGRPALLEDDQEAAIAHEWESTIAQPMAVAAILGDAWEMAGSQPACMDDTATTTWDSVFLSTNPPPKQHVEAADLRMDEDGLDSLVLEQLLGLTRDLKVTLPATEDDAVPTNSP
ncbi:unnamed protein product [Lampetra planeri]